MKIWFLYCFAVTMVCCGCQSERSKKTSDSPSGKFEELKAHNAYMVFGCVIKQGQYEMPVHERLTLSQAILRAKGFSSHANGNNVMLIRHGTGRSPRRIKVDAESILRGHSLKKDPLIVPGDFIIVDDTKLIF
jgi:polysaccharide export outer membrane protein